MSTHLNKPTADEREALWTQFLARWPLELLSQMTLQQYNQAGDDDHFCRWLEKHTEALGSIWGGSSLKFGIYSRSGTASKEPSAQKGVLQDAHYGWYAKYGATPDEAFAKVRQLIVQTAQAARAGRLDEVESIDLWPIFRRKIAFLYQDRQNPCLLPIYLRPMLQLAWQGDTDAPQDAASLYRGIMAQRGNRGLMAFYQDLLVNIKAAQAQQATAQASEVLSHFAAVPDLANRLQAAGQAEAFCRLALALNEAGLDWWITGTQAMHAGRTDDPKVWQTAVALELECTAQGLRGRLNTPADGAPPPAWQMLDSTLAEHWAEQAAADSRVSDLISREACWPDDYNQSSTTLTVLLSGGAVRNGYIKVPKLQALFPEHVIAADEKATSGTFQLILPNGTQIETCLLANRGRIKARFNGLFNQLGVQEGDRAVIQKEADGLYRLLINAVPHAAAAPASSTSAPPTSTSSQASPMSSEPLNQILYGPPGTGKTYATIERALRILDPALLAALKAETNPDQRRAAMKARFDALKAAGRVRFVTFHQSFSYEDFVEGIRAQSSPEGLRYSVEPGVFKQLCQDAADMPDVDKVIQQFLDDAADTPQTLTTPKGKPFTVTYQEGNETVACLPASSTTNKALPANIDAVKQVLRGQPPQKIYCESYVLGIANHLKPKLPASGAAAQVRQPHVLIIDEINRGNVSRIFGELITLIEPSKRAGQAEALSTTLPYSREPFTVPDNVYLIGTMNTADRSLASLDVALRRRFVFEELPPEPALLNGVKVAGRVPADALLSVMNQRIEALLDRDHLIGHASFMPLVAEPTLSKLAEVFRRQVLPLLQEYFFEDWQRIQWVLNDHRKPKALQFVRQSPVKVADLFGANVQVSARPLWDINEAAFDDIEAYAGVISSTLSWLEEADAPAEDTQ
ncbi:MAG: McrB family protein [Brachymonas sp.]